MVVRGVMVVHCAVSMCRALRALEKDKRRPGGLLPRYIRLGGAKKNAGKQAKKKLNAGRAIALESTRRIAQIRDTHLRPGLPRSSRWRISAWERTFF